MVPAMYTLCLMHAEFDAHDLSAWRIGGYGGAPMPVATIDALAARLPALALFNAYGATETTSPATMMPAGRRARMPTASACRCPARRSSRDRRRRSRGRRPARSASCGSPARWWCRGYWDNPDRHRERVHGGYWHSGDLGSVDADGFVRVFDRKKDMLNRGGYKIYSVEVENAADGMARRD